MSTWKSLIQREMDHQKESWADVVHTSLTEEELNREFDSGYGSPEGCPFLLWTKTRVYFPVQYDGSEWCESVPRKPCDEKICHVGGG